MKKIMNIIDSFEIPELGVIISGTNPELDNLNFDQIEQYIGKTILIQRLDNTSIEVDDIKIDVGTSLMGQKNINICLSNSVKLSELESNATVLSKQ